jgi:hypothetical protein
MEINSKGRGHLGYIFFDESSGWLLKSFNFSFLIKTMELKAHG